MRTCTIEGCDRQLKARGFCYMHYRRLLDGRPLDAPPRSYVNSTKGDPDDCDICLDVELTRGIPADIAAKRIGMSAAALDAHLRRHGRVEWARPFAALRSKTRRTA